MSTTGDGGVQRAENISPLPGRATLERRVGQHSEQGEIRLYIEHQGVHISARITGAHPQAEAR